MNSMYYRLETDKSEIGKLLDTNNRDNCKRNIYFRILESYMREIAFISERTHKSIRQSLELSCKMRNKQCIKCPIDIDAFNNNNWSAIKQTSCILETAYEMVRPSSIKIKRTECAFFFDSIESCEKYRTDFSIENGYICNVEIIEEYDRFVGDMNWLFDDLNISVNINEIKMAGISYWSAEMTDTPMTEILFKGEYKLHIIS